MKRKNQDGEEQLLLLVRELQRSEVVPSEVGEEGVEEEVEAEVRREGESDSRSIVVSCYSNIHELMRDHIMHHETTCCHVTASRLDIS